VRGPLQIKEDMAFARLHRESLGHRRRRLCTPQSAFTEAGQGLGQAIRRYRFHDVVDGSGLEGPHGML
jgi:hypothetical protein